MKANLWSNIILLFISVSLYAQNSPVQLVIDDLVEESIYENANISISIIDLEDSELIAEHRPYKVLVPASSLKLFTSYCGLKYLGETYKFETKLEYTGNIERDGTLKGDLYITGSGDPSFGSDRFKEILSFEQLLEAIPYAITEAGIKCIDGKLIIDESVFDSYPVSPSWQWNDLGNYYASGAWGLNINENLYYVHFKDRNIVGQSPTLHETYPHVPGLKLSNEVVLDKKGTGDNAYIFGGPYNHYKRIVGTIPIGTGFFTIKGSIPDPSSFFLHHIGTKFKEKKIDFQSSETIYRKVKDERTVIKIFSSPTLYDLIKATNFESLNLYSESILKMLGLNQRGQGSGQNGIAVLKNTLKNYGVDADDLTIHDGSGLSARNLIHSYSMAKFLAGIQQETDFDRLLNSLPKGGYSGTVKSLFKNSEAKGNVWLKSGSMQGIQSYSGFIRSKSGKWLSFCMIVNGYNTKGSIVRNSLSEAISKIYSAY